MSEWRVGGGMKEFAKVLFCYVFHPKVMMPVSEQRFGRYTLTRYLGVCPLCETVENGRIVRANQ